MPRSKSKTKSKTTSHSDVHSNPSHESLPSSSMQHMIPPISTLTSDPDHGEASELLNQNFPLSCARDEPATQPLLENVVFVPIPSPPPTPPPRGKKSQSRKSGKPVGSNTQEFTRSLQDQENIPHNPSSTSQVAVAVKTKTKRGKIQVPKSCRVLRPRGCQLSVRPEEEPLDGTGTCPSTVLRLIQDKEKNETPYWEASWDKWTHVRGTIRRKK